MALHNAFEKLAMEERFCSDRFDTSWDPLDLEILKKAFDATWLAVKENDPPIDFDSDAGLGLSSDAS